MPWPKVDFTKFGTVEVKPLARIKRISAQNLARNWVMVPAVTYHEDADIPELEAFRVATNRENEKSGLKITMLAFLIGVDRVRLGERLAVRWEFGGGGGEAGGDGEGGEGAEGGRGGEGGERRTRVPAELLRARMPSLLLQPLLENAVYHGIEPAAAAGEVIVRIARHARSFASRWTTRSPRRGCTMSATAWRWITSASA